MQMTGVVGLVRLTCLEGIVVSHPWYCSYLAESVVSLICGKLLRHGFERRRKTAENWRVVDGDSNDDDDDVNP